MIKELQVTLESKKKKEISTPKYILKVKVNTGSCDEMEAIKKGIVEKSQLSKSNLKSFTSK